MRDEASTLIHVLALISRQRKLADRPNPILPLFNKVNHLHSHQLAALTNRLSISVINKSIPQKYIVPLQVELLCRREYLPSVENYQIIKISNSVCLLVAYLADVLSGDI